MSSDFYVYIYTDPNTNMPFYVGKGKNDRCWDHINYARRNPKPERGKHFMNKIRKMIASGITPIVEKYCDSVDEFTAYATERQLIGEIGRKDLGTGPLLNLTEGGSGGPISPQILAEYHSRPDYRERARSRMKARWSDESNRHIQREKIKDVWCNDEKRRHLLSEKMKEDWKTNYHDKVEKCKTYYDDPANEEAIKNRHEKISNTLKKTSTFVLNNPRAAAVQTPLGLFDTKAKAAEAHGLTLWKFDQLLKREPQHYFSVKT